MSLVNVPLWVLDMQLARAPDLGPKRPWGWQLEAHH